MKVGANLSAEEGPCPVPTRRQRHVAAVIFTLCVVASGAQTALASIQPEHLEAQHGEAAERADEVWDPVLTDASKFFEAARDPQSGWVRDGFDADPVGKLSHLANFTKIPNVALDLHFLTAVAAGDLTGVISATLALDRMDRVLKTLEQVPSWNGFLYDVYLLNGAVPTLDPNPDRRIVSTIENGELDLALAALIGALRETPTAADHVRRAQALIARHDYGRLFDSGLLRGEDRPGRYHLDRVASEGRAAVLFAILQGQVPEAAWTNLGQPMRNYGGSKQRFWRVHASCNGAPFQLWWPLIYMDEAMLSPGLAKTQANALAIFLDHAQQKGWPAFPDAAWDPTANDYRSNGLPAIAECDDTRLRDFAAPHSLALGALVDRQTMAAWATAMVTAYPEIKGPYGWRDAVVPGTRQVTSRYLAVDQGLIVSSLLASHIRRYLDAYWSPEQRALMARLYSKVAMPQDVRVTTIGLPLVQGRPGK